MECSIFPDVSWKLQTFCFRKNMFSETIYLLIVTLLWKVFPRVLHWLINTKSMCCCLLLEFFLHPWLLWDERTVLNPVFCRLMSTSNSLIHPKQNCSKCNLIILLSIAYLASLWEISSHSPSWSYEKKIFTWMMRILSYLSNINL